MASPLVKICGLTTQEGVATCVEFHADFIGFVLYNKSPRHCTAQQFAQLAMNAGETPTVLVTVNASDALLDEYMDVYRPDYVQCHGDESPARLSEIRSRKVKIIKALGIAEVGDLSKISEYRVHADILLLDAKPVAGELPGGNAKRFDWSLLADANISGDWMLSGGLNIENVTDAIAQTGAPMVDVSSGVESAPGVKDVELIEAFRKNCHPVA
ncbi:MAG: phosphoribosylanthranilate isomerase [Rickettsiales bacterium]|nr:phosphoribosylanthranilate isomerase [Rickettsiales bacterium]